MYGDAVKENVKWVNIVLVSGTTLAALIIAIKSFNLKEFHWQNVNIPVDSAWLAIFAVTTANAYVAFLLFNALRRLNLFDEPLYKQRLFRDITNTGGLFVRGLLPRTEYHRATSGENVYEMSVRDPTSWLAVGAACLLIAAVIPFHALPPRQTLNYFALSVSLLWFNWKLAAAWIVGLSSLAIPEHKSRYVARLEWFRTTLSLTTWVAARGSLNFVIMLVYQAIFLAMVTCIFTNLAFVIRLLF